MAPHSHSVENDHESCQGQAHHSHHSHHSHGLSKSTRLMIIIGISFAFFMGEISVGFYTHSLALIADAFHYVSEAGADERRVQLNDLIGFVVALVAVRISSGESTPKGLSFGWQRAQLLGAFFNGVFLLALGLSIFLQSVERFASLKRVEDPKLVLIMGCIGLTLNIISAIFLHEHDHGPASHPPAAEKDSLDSALAHKGHRHKVDIGEAGHSHADLGMTGVMVHVIGDALNNIGVIIASTVIWQSSYEGRFYADPGVSMIIAIMIFASAIPLVKNSGTILLDSAPIGVNPDDIQHDLERVTNVLAVHELHVWRLSQHKALATAHVLTADDSLAHFMEQARQINECLHAYGIHSATLQPELVSASELEDRKSAGLSGRWDGKDASAVGSEGTTSHSAGVQVGVAAKPAQVRKRVLSHVNLSRCRMACGTVCESLACCAK